MRWRDKKKACIKMKKNTYEKFPSLVQVEIVIRPREYARRRYIDSESSWHMRDHLDIYMVESRETFNWTRQWLDLVLGRSLRTRDLCIREYLH